MKTTGCETEECQAAGAAEVAGGASEAEAIAEPRGPEAPRLATLEALGRELRETQAEVRRLRAFLSHGLRQPMAALTIWAELLNAKQSAALDEQGRRYLRELTASVHRIAAMLSSEMQAASTSGSDLPCKSSEEPRASAHLDPADDD